MKDAVYKAISYDSEVVASKELSGSSSTDWVANIHTYRYKGATAKLSTGSSQQTGVARAVGKYIYVVSWNSSEALMTYRTVTAAIDDEAKIYYSTCSAKSGTVKTVTDTFLCS